MSENTTPATKADLNEAMKANVEAIDETEQKLTKELHNTVEASEKRILDAIDRLEKFYDVDRRLKTVEAKLGISV